jgi:thymidylate synthase (FAD)
MKINVLDHGFVRLVSYMQPAPDYSVLDNPEYGGSGEDVLIYAHRGWRGDLEIVRNARVSFDANWRDGQDEGSDDRLVRRLHARGHTSPFEAMVFTFEVKAPIFVFRQWHRHRTWSYNELSARYGVLPEEFYVPEFDQIRPQSKTDKQGRQMDETIPTAATAQYSIRSHSAEAFRRYHEMIQMGVARELARSVLPVNTYSRMFATVNLHNLFHFLTLRLDSHAQYEIRVYAEALLQLIESVCPVAVAAFKTDRMNLAEITEDEWTAALQALDAQASITEDFIDENTPEDQEYASRLRSALSKLSSRVKKT